MEARLGADFSDVRVHAGAAARASAAAAGARAYTLGSHVVLGAPTADDQTLAHELAHVLQQREGTVSGAGNGPGLVFSDPSDRFERAAEAAAEHAIRTPAPRRAGVAAPRGGLRPSQVPARRAPADLADSRDHPPPGPPSRGVIQRVVIPSAPGNGLGANLDTMGLSGSKALIDAMWNNGNRAGLKALLVALQKAPPDEYQDNSRKLQEYISDYLRRQLADEPMKGNSGIFARGLVTLSNSTSDETGLTDDGSGKLEKPPDKPTKLQEAAMAVRKWQKGDVVSQIPWKLLGEHLQGRAKRTEYIAEGLVVLTKQENDEKKNKKTPAIEAKTATDEQKIKAAKAMCDQVSREMQESLEYLEKKEGVSYRTATSAQGVYGTAIVVGDFIMDKSFWSTSAIRGTVDSKKFGSEGTASKPNIYYIIEGINGVYAPRYTAEEKGVHEVMFRGGTIFRVQRIRNYDDKAFFVWVEEVIPKNGPVTRETKDPWTGAVNH
jgi:hypothetical protein